jgi:hypothetical protein
MQDVAASVDVEQCDDSRVAQLRSKCDLWPGYDEAILEAVPCGGTAAAVQSSFQRWASSWALRYT